MIDINVNIPLGIILNEVINNSLKYVFPWDKKGKLIIKFYKEESEFFLIVSDNGIGFPEDLLYEK